MRVLHPRGGLLCELAILKNMKMFMQLWDRYYHGKIAVARSSQITFCRQLSQAGKRARSQCSAAPATSNTAVTTINQEQHVQPSTTNNHQPPPTSTNNNHQPPTTINHQQTANTVTRTLPATSKSTSYHQPQPPRPPANSNRVRKRDIPPRQVPVRVLIKIILATFGYCYVNFCTHFDNLSFHLVGSVVFQQ